MTPSRLTEIAERLAQAKQDRFGYSSSHYQRMMISAPEDLTHALAVIARLQAALEKYGRHLNLCEAEPHFKLNEAKEVYMVFPSGSCTCGLTAALTQEVEG